jgi:ABC-2 type transport system permease protein
VITLIRVELLKLRTARMTYGLLAAAAGLSALFCTLEAVRSGVGKPVAPLYTAAGLNSVITGGVWSMMFAMALGAIMSSGEFRHSTATFTYLVTPRRERVLAAKAIAAACAGMVFGLVGWLIPTGVGLAFVASHGYHVAVTDATMARYAAGHLVAGALLAAVGVGLGALIRSQLAVVIGVFVWSIVIESLVGGLFTSVRPYLPYTAATTLAGTPLGGAAFGAARTVASGAGPLPFAGAAALVAAMAAALALIAARTTVRRDITQ